MKKGDGDGRGTTRDGCDTGAAEVFVNDDVEGSQLEGFTVKHPCTTFTGASPRCKMQERSMGRVGASLAEVSGGSFLLGTAVPQASREHSSPRVEWREPWNGWT